MAEYNIYVTYSFREDFMSKIVLLFRILMVSLLVMNFGSFDSCDAAKKDKTEIAAAAEAKKASKAAEKAQKEAAEQKKKEDKAAAAEAKKASKAAEKDQKEAAEQKKKEDKAAAEAEKASKTAEKDQKEAAENKEKKSAKKKGKNKKSDQKESLDIQKLISVDKVTISDGKNFSGKISVLGEGDYMTKQLGIEDNTLQSISIPKGFVVILNDEDELKGNSIGLNATEVNLKIEDLEPIFDKKTSSISITKEN